MSIFETLKLLGLSSEKTREIYSYKTRDVDPLTVYKDTKSGVIFIDDFYIGEQIYESGTYRQEELVSAEFPDLEAKQDAHRRYERFKQQYIGKDIADFGCGSGNFLRLVSKDCNSQVGIELQKDFVEFLNNDDIRCVRSLSEIDDNSLDSIFSFHSLEHLHTPIDSLNEMYNKLKVGGCIVIEVPHANDFLCSIADNKAFREFTLWSQHLILHTRDSLMTLLNHCRFHGIVIEGCQRYPLSNHFNWLINGLPGGHKSKLSIIDDEDLNQAYSSALSRIDANDTIIALAYKK